MTKRITKLTIRKTPIGSVTRHPKNNRRGDVDKIMESLSYHGQYAPIVIQQSTGYVIKGNHTHEAAERLGWAKIDATWLDVDDDQALRILLVDNASSDAATNDRQATLDLLQSLNGSLDGTGFEPADVDDLLAELDPPDDGAPADDQTGDLDRQWAIVIDCTDEDQQAALLERFETEGLACRAVIA